MNNFFKYKKKIVQSPTTLIFLLNDISLGCLKSTAFGGKKHNSYNKFTFEEILKTFTYTCLT